MYKTVCTYFLYILYYFKLLYITLFCVIYVIFVLYYFIILVSTEFFMTQFNEFNISRILEKWIIYLWAKDWSEMNRTMHTWHFISDQSLLNSESKIVTYVACKQKKYINSWNREFIKLCGEQHIRKKILLFYISRIPILFIAFYIVSIYSSIYLRNPAWLVFVSCVCVFVCLFVCLYFGQKAWWWPDLTPKLNMRYKSEKCFYLMKKKILNRKK